MAQLLGLIILSFFITGILLIPFIDFLYKIKLRRQNQVTRDVFNKRTPLFDKFNKWKVGTPFGGGILIIVVSSILTLWAYGIFNIAFKPWEFFIILFSFFGFGALGLYDDLKKLVNGKDSFFGLRFRYKFIIQWILAFIIAFVLYTKLGYDFIFIHGYGLASLGFLFVPLAAFIIVSFVNAFNIADGLDGLAAGLFLICMIAFLAITSTQLDQSLGIFIAIVVGSVAAFLYFNIYKARIWLGDVGSLALGATLAVVGLLTGKIIALAVIGGFFVLEVGSSLIQLMGKKFLGRKIFPASPLHLYLLKIGWEEPKIVMRAWLFGLFLAVLGLYIAFIR
ncbi:phospho-N-acetylmuramoyl-pentapeptide-transferase [Candidatus Microgenomates bacterium]|nr:MAG: phospho-N-acetylmuramoyl-pentapeptide-transferase [Candidatus Microgenomates bacterium]